MGRPTPFAIRYIAQAILCMLLMLCCILGSDPLMAQQGPCASNDSARVTIASIKRAGKDIQIKEAMTLIKTWASSLPDLMSEIAQIKPAHLNDPADIQWAQFIVDVVKTMLASNDQAIRLFRQCPIREGAIVVLAWTARGDDNSLRLNGANILANVVDNTTVCFVLQHLRDPTISPRGRANLLGVTRAMASYAYEENVTQIRETVALVEKQMTSQPAADTVQAKTLITDIRERLDKSTNKGTKIPSELASFCKEYTYTERPKPI
jgi:hypothetical protein